MPTLYSTALTIFQPRTLIATNVHSILGNTCTNIVHVCLIAEWVSIGEMDYNFYAVVLSHVAAKTRCLQEGGKLFEPKDE